MSAANGEPDVRFGDIVVYTGETFDKGDLSIQLSKGTRLRFLGLDPMSAHLKVIDSRDSFIVPRGYWNERWFHQATN